MRRLLIIYKMLSKISSRSGKRLILSALHKFIANIKSKSATPNAPIAQYLSLANFSGPNNLNNNVGYASSHCGRAYSTNYFKPVSKIAITFQ